MAARFARRLSSRCALLGQTLPRPLQGSNLAVGPMLEVTLSFDHRAIDGGLTQRFMARIRENLEEPVKALI